VTRPFDVVIVGGGLVGAALGYELAGDGVRTLLVDRHDVGRATDAGAGILSPETIFHADDDWFALAMAAGEHYRRLIPALAEAGAPDPGYAECGLLNIAFREGDDATFTAVRALAQRRCPDTVVDLAPSAAHDLFPALGEVRAALHNPRAARVDGRQLAAALVHAADERGLQQRAGSVHELVRDGDRVIEVVIDDDRVACGAVVIAGGAWTPSLGDQLGVSLPVVPVRGQIAHFRLEGVDTSGWPIVQPVLSYYTVPWPDGRLAGGGTFEPEAGFDARATAHGVRELIREVVGYAPAVADATLLEVRVGLRPVSIDDAPILGAVPGMANAFVATGHGANGLLLGPLSARLVADLVLDRTPALDLAPFSASRFD
jgi:D-amino-acid dehydrogenase